MIGAIVKEITKVSDGIYSILGDNVYPLRLPENKIITPSAVYSITDIQSNSIQNRAKTFDIDVSFRVITDSYSNLDELLTTVITGFLSIKGDMNGKRINYIKLINSQDIFNTTEVDDKIIYGNDMIFTFNVSIK